MPKRREKDGEEASVPVRQLYRFRCRGKAYHVEDRNPSRLLVARVPGGNHGDKDCERRSRQVGARAISSVS